MKNIHAGLLGVIALVASVSSAEALVLCVAPSGLLAVLKECRGGMKQIDPAAIGLVGPAGEQGPAGPQGAEGPAGPAGPSDAYANYGATDLQRIVEGTTQTVSSVTLPIGTYTLAATVYGVALEDARFLSCNFISFGSLNGGRAALISFDDLKQPLIGEVTISVDGTSVYLRCSALSGDFDVGGELIATRVGAITPSL
jgi:hypothetical protein